ncbi:hypothetical protein Taro_004744 [Colocasia esculenta]|uniref:F-box domain-containing protein n=1 Tax=Colocasia esculenta TaxID=4460 RepID=A0A843TSM0_COLES|nr:hypothetical protein [Colocasia esculenta]
MAAAMRRGRRDLINGMLPDELLIDIFGHLECSKSSRDACALVCHRWHSLERASRRSVRMGASGNADQLARLLVDRFPSLCSIFVDERLPAALCPQIRFPGSPASSGRKPRARKALAKSGTDVHGTVLSSESEEMDSDRSSLSDAGLTVVSRGCQKLEKLSLIWCSSITSLGLQSVAANCSILRSLDLQVYYLLYVLLEEFCISATDDALEAIGSFSSSLELLALYSFQKFTDKGLTAIGEGCKRLKNLMLSDCYFLTDKSLLAIASGCTELTHLEINGCHNIAVAEEVRSSMETSFQIGDKGIISVGEHCKRLVDLSLRFCDRVGDDALVAISRGCSLQSLNVSGCHKITDVGLTAVARGCPELVFLDVSVLQNLSDMALEEVGQSCPLLKDIVLSHCPQVTDTGLAHLANGCAQLQSCQMVYCPHITSAGVATVVSVCTSIKKVLIEKWKVSQRTRRKGASVLSFLCVDL